MLFISCCSLAVLLSVSNVIAGDETSENKQSLLSRVRTNLPSLPKGKDIKVTETLKNLICLYGLYHGGKLSYKYLLCPTWNRVKPALFNRNKKNTVQSGSCKEEAKKELTGQQTKAKSGKRFYIF